MSAGRHRRGERRRPAARHGRARRATDHVVRPAKLWNDTESAPDARLADRSARRGGARRAWATACGSVPVAAFTITKLSWLHRSEPDAWARVARVCLPHDWLTWKLTRRVRHRPRRRVGHRLLLRGARRVPARPARDRRRRRRLVDARSRACSGRPSRPARPRAFGSNAVVAPGTGDNMAAAVALGLRPGDVAISLGTSGTVYTVSESADRRPDGRGRRIRRRDRPLPAARVHAERDEGHRHGRGLARCRPRGPRRAGARGAAGRGRRRARALLRRRAHAEPARTRRVRSPGCAPSTTREHLARAAIEGVVCGLLDGLDALTDAGRPRRRQHRARRRRRAIGRVPAGARRPLGPAGRRARRAPSTSRPVRACRPRRCCDARTIAEVAREWDLGARRRRSSRASTSTATRCAPRTPKRAG